MNNPFCNGWRARDLSAYVLCRAMPTLGAKRLAKDDTAPKCDSQPSHCPPCHQLYLGSGSFEVQVKRKQIPRRLPPWRVRQFRPGLLDGFLYEFLQLPERLPRRVPLDPKPKTLNQEPGPSTRPPPDRHSEIKNILLEEKGGQKKSKNLSQHPKP